MCYLHCHIVSFVFICFHIFALSGPFYLFVELFRTNEYMRQDDLSPVELLDEQSATQVMHRHGLNPSSWCQTKGNLQLGTATQVAAADLLQRFAGNILANRGPTK